jgi:hypothetical protein
MPDVSCGNSPASRIGGALLTGYRPDVGVPQVLGPAIGNGAWSAVDAAQGADGAGELKSAHDEHPSHGKPQWRLQ